MLWKSPYSSTDRALGYEPRGWLGSNPPLEATNKERKLQLVVCQRLSTLNRGKLLRVRQVFINLQQELSEHIAIGQQ